MVHVIGLNIQEKKNEEYWFIFSMSMESFHFKEEGGATLRLTDISPVPGDILFMIV